MVSFDLFEETFCCDTGVCHGACCIEGDSGAPLEPDEIEQIEELLPRIMDIIPEECRQVIERDGVAYVDSDGELVTQIVNGRECVFSYIDPADGCRRCAIEKLCREGHTSFLKPISCHLYPVRLDRFDHFTAVNYHRWEICQCAVECGRKLRLPLYKFLREPLIRRFGADWYAELCHAADDYERAFSK